MKSEMLFKYFQKHAILQGGNVISTKTNDDVKAYLHCSKSKSLFLKRNSMSKNLYDSMNKSRPT